MIAALKKPKLRWEIKLEIVTCPKFMSPVELNLKFPVQCGSKLATADSVQASGLVALFNLFVFIITRD